MNRTSFLFVVALALGGIQSGLYAQQKTVVLKDGREISGTVEKTDSGYQITTKGGTLVVPEDQVGSVRDYLPPAAEFEQRKAALKADDAAGHYDLAAWAKQKGLLQQAVDELETVLSIQPDNQNAQLLLRVVNAQIANAPKPSENPAQPTRPVTPATNLPAGNLLSEADINRIKVEELRSTDANVQVALQNKLLEKFLDLYHFRGTATEARLRHSSPAAQAVFILTQLRPEDSALKNDILVKGDPGSMLAFRNRIWPVLQQNCATISCHGGQHGAGNLKLYNLGASNDPAIAYTNFYILDSLQNKSGRMIDRDRPEASLLLQYGLPPDIAAAKHPMEISPMFRNTQESLYQQILAWITDGLIHPRPAYDLEYKAPGAASHAPTTAPTAPATPSVPHK